VGFGTTVGAADVTVVVTLDAAGFPEPDPDPDVLRDSTAGSTVG
jgi:hypothetical protein